MRKRSGTDRDKLLTSKVASFVLAAIACVASAQSADPARAAHDRTACAGGEIIAGTPEYAAAAIKRDLLK
jgi:hypothetical protein